MDGPQRSKNKRSPIKWWVSCLLLVVLFWFVLNNPIWHQPPPSSAIPIPVENDHAREPAKEISQVTSGENEVPGHNHSPILNDGSIEIFGKVFFEGDIPRPIRLENIRSQCEEIRFQVAADRGLANAFVYVKRGLEEKRFPQPTARIEMNETNCWFEPHLIGLQVNQLAVIKNYKALHHFKLRFSSGSEIEWLANERREEDLEFSFDGQDVFSTLTCSVHPWPWAYFGVVSHPFFTVTDRNGKFRLPKGLLPGKYTIAARHPYTAEAIASVIAVAGGKYPLSFTLGASPDSTKPHPMPPINEADEASEVSNNPTDSHDVSGIARNERNVSIERYGTIRGKVFLNGNPPPEKIIPLSPDCAKLHDEPLKTRIYLVNPEKELADVLVFISSGLRQKSFLPPTNSVQLVQNGCEFSPYVFGIRTGQPLQVQNADRFLHNVHVRSQSPEKEFNFSLWPSASRMIKFEHPNPFTTIKCDVHPWEFSYAYIFDHPYFCVTSTNGDFEISHVPRGFYTVSAAHRKAGVTTTEKVEVTSGMETALVFKLDAK